MNLGRIHEHLSNGNQICVRLYDLAGFSVSLGFVDFSKKKKKNILPDKTNEVHIYSNFVLRLTRITK